PLPLSLLLPFLARSFQAGTSSRSSDLSVTHGMRSELGLMRHASQFALWETPPARLMCVTVRSARSRPTYGRPSGLICCLSRQRWLTRLKSLGTIKDDHALFATDGSPLRAGTQNSEGLVVKERTVHPDKFPPLGRRAGLNVAPPRSASASGIEVHEERWGTVTVQHVYKMRCECGRSWFELELPRFVRC